MTLKYPRECDKVSCALMMLVMLLVQLIIAGVSIQPRAHADKIQAQVWQK